MNKLVRIQDLASPRLSELQQSILEFADSTEVTLAAEDILDEASASLNLHDFGEADFRLRLNLLCEEWSSISELNNLGRMNLRGKLLSFAKNRLLIQRLLSKHPEIHEVEIVAPIIVAGLPRSGTTHLLNLMASDSRLRALPLWESYEPLPTPGEGLLADGTDPRYRRCADAWEMMQQAVPLLGIMHPMNPDHIHEELELMGPDFASYNFEWLCQCPRWRDHYYATDQSPHYEYMKTVLKILTWQDGDRSGSQTRWVLKCPQHMEQLPVLLKTFPDATLALTHRDPVAVIQSACTMLAYGQRMSRSSIDLGEILDYWTDRIRHLLHACVRDREIMPEAQSIDVLFHEFMADDLAMVAAIFGKAGLEMNATAGEQLQRFMAQHQRGRDGQIEYCLQQDFGVAPADLRKKFDFYFDRFAVRPEQTYAAA